MKTRSRNRQSASVNKIKSEKKKLLYKKVYTCIGSFLNLTGEAITERYFKTRITRFALRSVNNLT